MKRDRRAIQRFLAGLHLLDRGLWRRRADDGRASGASGAARFREASSRVADSTETSAPPFQQLGQGGAGSHGLLGADQLCFAGPLAGCAKLPLPRSSLARVSTNPASTRARSTPALAAPPLLRRQNREERSAAVRDSTLNSLRLGARRAPFGGGRHCLRNPKSNGPRKPARPRRSPNDIQQFGAQQGQIDEIPERLRQHQTEHVLCVARSIWPRKAARRQIAGSGQVDAARRRHLSSDTARRIPAGAWLTACSARAAHGRKRWKEYRVRRKRRKSIIPFDELAKQLRTCFRPARALRPRCGSIDAAHGFPSRWAGFQSSSPFQTVSTIHADSACSRKANSSACQRNGPSTR